jgi:UDP-glucose 4-epimerase
LPDFTIKKYKKTSEHWHQGERVHMVFSDQCILITGGTGSLGKTLVRRLLTGELGRPRKIIVFSRDEAKQHYMRLEYQQRTVATDEVIYHNFEELVEFRIGDVRDYFSVVGAIKTADIVINAAALKQVPTCEYFPYEAVQTNITGPENIVRAIRQNGVAVKTVVGVSTDKACKPVNVMGMTKALQERIFLSANITCPDTRFICVRYGNVLASRGSVIPLFHDQIKAGGPVTITTDDMTRFLLSLDDSVDLIFGAVQEAQRGQTFVPRVPSARVVDIARVLIGERNIPIKAIGIRPGEKIHEILISEEEAFRTIPKERFYCMNSILPEVARPVRREDALQTEYSSSSSVMPYEKVAGFLERHNLLLPESVETPVELLR